MKGVKPLEAYQAPVFQVNAKKLEEIHIPQMLFEAICSKRNKQTRNNEVRKAKFTLNAPTAKGHLRRLQERQDNTPPNLR